MHCLGKLGIQFRPLNDLNGGWLAVNDQAPGLNRIHAFDTRAFKLLIEGKLLIQLGSP